MWIKQPQGSNVEISHTKNIQNLFNTLHTVSSGTFSGTAYYAQQKALSVDKVRALLKKADVYLHYSHGRAQRGEPRCLSSMARSRFGLSVSPIQYSARDFKTLNLALFSMMRSSTRRVVLRIRSTLSCWMPAEPQAVWDRTIPE